METRSANRRARLPAPQRTDVSPGRRRPTDPPPAYQIEIASGRCVVRSASGRSARRDNGRKGRLYVHLAPEGAVDPDVVARWEQCLAESYFGPSSGSLTSALSGAISDLNDLLLDENDSIRLRSPRRCGLAAIVIRGGEAFFALAGGSIAYVVGPSGGDRLDSDEGGPAGRRPRPLGVDDDVEVQMFHRPIAPPWSIVLGSPGILSFDRNLTKKLDAHCDDPLGVFRRAATAARSVPPCDGLVVASDACAEPDDDADADPVETTIRLTSSPIAAPRRPVFPPTAPPRAPEWTREAPRRDEWDDERPEVRPRHDRASASRSRGGWDRDLDLDPDESEDAFALEDLGPIRRLPDVRGVVAVARALAERLTARSPELEDGEWADLTPSGVDARRNEDAPDPESRGAARPRRARRRASRVDWRRIARRIPLAPSELAMFAGIAVVLFIVGYLLVVVPVRLVRDGTAYASALNLVGQAEQREGEALNENDPVLRKQLLNTASQFAAEAQSSQPDSSTIAATTARIHQEYQAATGAAMLGAPSHIVELPAPSDELALKGVNLFALDRANSRVYQYLLSADGTTALAASNPVLVQRGDHLGLVTVGQLTHLAWVPAGNGRTDPALVVLDDSGFLVSYAPSGGLGVLGLRDPTTWGGVTALAGGNGTLYALRSAAGTFTAYPPQASGYDGAPTALAPDASADFSDAVALAADADQYVARKDGTLLHLVDGKPASDTPDTSKLFAGPPAGLALGASAVFIGDPKGQRIVQLTRDGRYQRYLTVPDPTNVLARTRDLAISDDGSALYVLADSAVYRLGIPPRTP